MCRSQWPRGLRRGSAAACLLRSWVRIPPGAWVFVCCEFSSRGLCYELITRPEESYRLWRVVVCDLESSWMWRPWSLGGCRAQKKKKKKKKRYIYKMWAEIAQSVWLATGWTGQRSNPGGGKIFFTAPVQTVSGVHPASYTMDTGSFPGVKRPGSGVDQPRRSGAEVEERVELYLHFISGRSWSVIG